MSDFVKDMRARLVATHYFWLTSATSGGEIVLKQMGYTEEEAKRVLASCLYSGDQPLAMLADVIYEAQAKHDVNIMQITFTRNAIIVQTAETGSSQKMIVLEDPVITKGLANKISRYSRTIVPPSADTPTTAISEMPLVNLVSPKELVVPMRITVSAGLLVEEPGAIGKHISQKGESLNVSVRTNFAVDPELVFAGVPKTRKDRLIEAACNRETIVVAGPSGSGKTTVMQALLALAAERDPMLRVVALGRFIEPVVFSKRFNAIGIPTERELPFLYDVLQFTQRSFGDTMLLERVVGHGPTRTDPDMIIVDEMLVSGDVVVALAAVTAGTGFMATIHTRIPNVREQYRERIKLLGSNAQIPMAADADIVIGVDRRVIVEIDDKNAKTPVWRKK